MSRRNLKVAVVGLGKMGLLHSCILNVLPDIQLVALCEKNALTCRLMRKLFNRIQIVNDAKALAKFDVDVVYVTTPIPSHFQIVKAIYAENIARNLFVEKTLAASHEEARELCALAQNARGIDMVGYLRRFYVTFRKAKDILSRGILGELLSFRAYAFSSDFLGHETSVAPRGGVLRDLGCHALDLGLWFFGDMKVCEAQTVQLSIPSASTLSFKVRNSAGAEGLFQVSWCRKDYRTPEVGFSIIGSKGIMDVNDDKVEIRLGTCESVTWYRQDLDDSVPFWLGLPEYYREDSYFIGSILDNRTAEPSFSTAARVDELIDEAEGANAIES